MDNIEKKKRGRRKKIAIVDSSMNNVQYSIDELKNDVINPEVTPAGKKRGRKPKGGKLILKKQDEIIDVNLIPNVILHLKCSLNDLDDYNTKMSKMMTNPLSYNPDIPPDILTYNSSGNSNNFSLYDKKYVEESINANDQGNIAYIDKNIFQLTNNTNNEPNTDFDQNICSVCRCDIDQNIKDDDDDVNNKDITMKIKQLKINLYKNTLQDKKSACFWCTYEYDSPPCYIPKYEMDEKLYGYGSFCRPECAVAYLMKENLDDSMKFERYHLLNQIYGKVYQHKKNIKPAPNPYFLLERFYGNLTIQEYRKLLKSEHMLLVVEKPMTRILPELFEDNEDFILNIYGGNKGLQSNNSSIYKVKRQSEQQQGPSKTSIMRDKFGM